MSIKEYKHTVEIHLGLTTITATVISVNPSSSEVLEKTTRKVARAFSDLLQNQIEGCLDIKVEIWGASCSTSPLDDESKCIGPKLEVDLCGENHPEIEGIVCTLTREDHKKTGSLHLHNESGIGWGTIQSRKSLETILSHNVSIKKTL